MVEQLVGAIVNEGGGEMAHSEGNSLGSDFPSDAGDDALAFAQQESDFVRYFLSLPEAPPEDDDAPEQTFEDLVEESETIQGADRVAARARMEDPGPATALMLDATSGVTPHAAPLPARIHNA